MSAAPGVSGQFLGRCEKVVFGEMYNGAFARFDDAWVHTVAWPPGPGGDYDGEICIEEAEYAVRDFQFAITNPAIRWSQTLATNTPMNYSTNDPAIPGYESGEATVSRTVTLNYVPDQPTVAFTATPTNGPAALTVQFNAEARDSGGNGISS
jgi:PKD repeat protein